MTNPYFEDKRLLEALNFIDERFIAEVTEDYEIFDLPGEYKPNRKRTFRAYRQFISLAACLILLSGAFPVIVGFVSGTFDFLAGRGSNPYENYDPMSSPIYDYPVSMSVDDIYADVMQGGWVVSNDYTCVSNEQLVEEFYSKVKDRKPASLLLAQYISAGEEYSYVQTRYKIEKDGYPSIELAEVVFDGKKLTYIFRFIHSATLFECEELEEYKYIKKTEDSRSNTVYYLTDDIMTEYGPSWWSSSAPAPRRKLIFTSRS